MGHSAKILRGLVFLLQRIGLVNMVQYLLCNDRGWVRTYSWIRRSDYLDFRYVELVALRFGIRRWRP